MDVQIESPSLLSRKLKITVPADVFDQEYNKTIDQQKDKIKINGFRPGKVPRSILEKRYREAFRAEAMEKLIPDYVSKILTEKNITPAYRPEISELKMEQGEPLYFEADFEVVPVPEGDFTGLFELEKPDVSVTDEEVTEDIEKMRRSYGKKQDTDEPAQIGDMVAFKILEQNGQPVPDGEPIEFELRPENEQISELVEGLLGTKSEDTKTVVLKAEQQENGEEKKPTITISVLSVKKIIPAEMNEAFFEYFSAGRVKNEADFVQLVRKKLEDGKAQSALRKMHDTVRDSIYDTLRFDVPEKMLAQRKQQIFSEFKSVEMRKEMFNKRFAENETDGESAGEAASDVRKAYEIKPDEELEKNAAEIAEKQMRMMYFVDHIFTEQKMQVSRHEQIEEFIRECYARRIHDPQKYAQSDEGKQLMEMVAQSLVEMKVLNHLITSKYGSEFIPIAQPEQAAGQADSPDTTA